MGGGSLHQRHHHGVDKDDEQLFDSDSDDDENSEEDSTSSSPDATSPTSLTANMNPNGASSALMEHLPVKRGLSKHYQGKSQSYMSLSAVSSKWMRG